MKRKAAFTIGSLIPLLVSLGLLGLVWVVFGQTLGHDFVNYDDPSYVYENPRITAGLSLSGIGWAFTHVHGQNWHPLTTISHMWDCQVYGMRAGGHHLTNVLLHALGSVLLFFGLRQLTGATWRSAIVAAVFAIHPLRVESVAWVAERKDVLSGVFFMLTLLSYARYVRKPSLCSYACVAGSVALGLMSKPMLVTLPAVLLLLDYWPLRRFEKPADSLGERRRWRGLFVEKIPLAVLVIGACAATLAAQSRYIGVGENLPWWWRIENALVSYVTYIREMIWPAGLVPFYPHPENTLTVLEIMGALAALVLATVFVVWQRRTRPYLLTGWLWYLGMLVPVIGLVQVGWQGHADRYTYLPEIGLGVALVWGTGEWLARSRARRATGAALAGMVVIGLTSAAWKQTTYWRDSETLWRHTLAVLPDNDVAHTNLAVVLLARGHEAEARMHFETALRLRPDNVSAHISLANMLLHEGDPSGGLAHLQRVLEIEPGNAEARNLLGLVFLQQGETGAALREWEKTIEFDPDNGNACSNLAWVYATNPDASIRNGTLAVKLAREAVVIAGGRNALVLRTLAAALAEAGQFDEAISTAETARVRASAEGNTALTAELDATLKLYGSRAPLRDPGQGRTPPSR